MLDTVKDALRIKMNIFDSDIKRLIAAAELDLSLSGIKKIEESNALIQQAVILYCKAHFERKPDEDIERILKAYESLKITISLCGDYI